MRTFANNCPSLCKSHSNFLSSPILTVPAQLHTVTRGLKVRRKKAAGGGGRVGRLVPAPSPEHISLCSDHSWGGAVGPRVAPARVAKPWRLVWPAPRPLWESRWGPPRTGGKPCPGQGLLLAQHCHLPAGLSIAARAPGGEPCLGDWRGPPCRCENEAQRAPRVSPVSRGMSLPGLEARPCVAPEPSAHFASRHILTG